MIRQLTIDDLELILPLGLVFSKEAQYPGGFVPEIFIRNWKGHLENGFGVIFGMFKDEQLVGILGGFDYSDPNNDDLVAMETFWYVAKEHRGGGIKLLDAFEAWAKERGAKRVVMAYVFTSMPEVVKSIYEKRGYGPLEMHYSKEV